MKTIKMLTLATAVLGALVSCETRFLDMTIASTKNIDLNNPQGYVTQTNARVRGKADSYIVTVIPLGYPSAKEAVDRAIEDNGGNAVGLSNVVFYESSWYIPLLFGKITLTAEGDPIYKK